jgi:hypothetical protein
MSSLLRHSLRLSITRAISAPTALLTTPPALTTTTTTTLRTRAYATNKAKSKHRQKGGGNSNSSADAESESLPSSSSSSSAPHSGSKKRSPIATASLTPGSQQALADPAARDEYARAHAKMAACVEWFRREVAQLDARASGRVAPQLLAPVRVSVVAHSSSSSASASASAAKKVRLEEVATVGVRDGSTLIVTVFDPQVSLWLFACKFACTRSLPVFPHRMFLL